MDSQGIIVVEYSLIYIMNISIFEGEICLVKGLYNDAIGY
jgi:hypothetical protein